MPSLFATGSRPLPISVPSPDVVVALLPSPLVSALACHRCRHRLSSLARQRPPLPAVVVALVPCLSASALACHCCRRQLSSLACQRPLACHHRCSRPLPVRVRPHLTSMFATRLLSLARQRPLACRCRCRRRPRPRRPTATLTIPITSVIQRRHDHCCQQAIFAAAVAANLVLFGLLDIGFTTKPYHTSKSEASSLVGFVGWFGGWFAAKHSPPLGCIMRRIVLAFTRPRVSIHVTGLGFEPFAVCGFPTRALAFARYWLYH